MDRNICKRLKELGKSLSKFTVGAEGNISMKTENGFLIKASGARFENLSVDDFVECDINGQANLSTYKKPSIETPLHAFLYKTFDIKFIAHTHPTNTLSILCTNLINTFASNRLFPDQVVYNGKKSCIINYAHPGDELLNNIKNELKKFSDVPSLILLKNHGIICIGDTELECIISTEICEKAAEIFFKSFILSKEINFLSDEEIEKIANDKKEIYRKKL